MDLDQLIFLIILLIILVIILLIIFLVVLVVLVVLVCWCCIDQRDFFRPLWERCFNRTQAEQNIENVALSTQPSTATADENNSPAPSPSGNEVNAAEDLQPAASVSSNVNLSDPLSGPPHSVSQQPDGPPPPPYSPTRLPLQRAESSTAAEDSSPSVSAADDATSSPYYSVADDSTSSPSVSAADDSTSSPYYSAAENLN